MDLGQKRSSQNKGDLGLDLAGGAMGNKHFFSTKKYVCVDINLKDLERGKTNIQMQ